MPFILPALLSFQGSAHLFGVGSFSKLFFTIHDEWQLSAYKDCYIIKQFTKDKSITASHEPYGKNRYFDLTTMINNL